MKEFDPNSVYGRMLRGEFPPSTIINDPTPVFRGKILMHRYAAQLRRCLISAGMNPDFANFEIDHEIEHAEADTFGPGQFNVRSIVNDFNCVKLLIPSYFPIGQRTMAQTLIILKAARQPSQSFVYEGESITEGDAAMIKRLERDLRRGKRKPDDIIQDQRPIVHCAYYMGEVYALRENIE